MRFRLRQMELFRAVMLTGSVKAAAKLLSMSQPAVSRGIAHTEQSLGYPLFDRIGGRLCPTDEAKALIADVESCYLHAMQVNDLAMNLRNGSAGALNICVSHCLSRGVAARAVARFLHRHPKVHVQLRACTLADMPRMLLSNQADLAIAVVPLEHVNLEAEVVTTGRMVCVMPDDHALAGKQQISLRDLSDVAVIAPHPSIAFGQLIGAALDRAGVSLNVRVDIWHMDVACALVASGVGVALLDEFTVQGLPYNHLRAVPLKEEIQLTPAVLRSSLGVGRPYIAPFISALKEQAALERAEAAMQRG